VRALTRTLGSIALALAFSLANAAGPAFPPQASAYLIQGDGKTLWAKDPDRPLPPASLTKLMTALVALEHVPADAVASITAEAARETGSRIGLVRGDRLTVRELVAAALIASANDACHALADLTAGDEARFVQMMNDEAGNWGLANTHFANACGHDQPSHRASARDLAALTARALQQPLIATFVALPELRIRTTDGHKHFHLVNGNALIGHYPGAIGVKSGYTPAAGKCVIAAARRDGHSVVLVILNAPNRWWDASDAIDRAFAELDRPS
jgi:D-alanyl-D-alanine carboxypeptidase (penicillin-binding protein 5/6)